MRLRAGFFLLQIQMLHIIPFLFFYTLFYYLIPCFFAF